MNAVRALRVVTDGLRADTGGEAAAARRRAIDNWLPALRFANRHLVAPALYASLARAGVLSDLPEDVREYLTLLHRANRARNVALRRQAGAIIAMLNRSGVTPMLLKGGLALFLDHHADPGARMIGDLDFLVRRQDLSAAKAGLKRLGYRVETLYTPLLHAYAEFTRPGQPGAVDLHIELIDVNHLLPASEVWLRARPRKDEGLDFFVPSPEDALLHNLWHDQLHYLGEFYRGNLSLRQLHDFVRLALAGGAGLGWARIEDRAARLDLATPLHAYLLAAQDLLGLPWPLAQVPGAVARLHAVRARLQLAHPVIGRIWLPWANLRAAFAPHRMVSLYGNDATVTALRLHHAIQFLAKRKRPTLVGRLFRLG